MAHGENTLNISWETIFRILATLAGVYLVYLVLDVLAWLIFAVIISILFNPPIDFFQKRGIPRMIATVLVYFGIFGVFTLFVYLITPIFIKEVKEFIQVFPEYFDKIAPPLRGLGFEAFENAQTFFTTLNETLIKMSGNIFSGLFAFFGGVFSAVFVITLAIFISLEERVVEGFLKLVFPKRYETTVLGILQRCQNKVVGWFGARILSCIFVGILSYIILILFNVKYPFALALMAGVFNFIPYAGPLFTGILLLLIFLPQNILKGVFVIAAFTMIQQIENHIVSPILMKKFVGLPPVLVLLSLVVGAKLWGFLGSVLVIPLAGIVFEFVKEFLHRRKTKPPATL